MQRQTSNSTNKGEKGGLENTKKGHANEDGDGKRSCTAEQSHSMPSKIN
jgi:hypothetical protein